MVHAEKKRKRSRLRSSCRDREGHPFGALDRVCAPETGVRLELYRTIRGGSPIVDAPR